MYAAFLRFRVFEALAEYRLESLTQPGWIIGLVVYESVSGFQAVGSNPAFRSNPAYGQFMENYPPTIFQATLVV